ncbi:MAG TPA: sugar ABC transporter permease [Devosiaceae bacterium]|jgi:multiple sugar transport system permease protein|nr:sugar ABC transporter permease [Devosiaceae bacterium]
MMNRSLSATRFIASPIASVLDFHRRKTALSYALLLPAALTVLLLIVYPLYQIFDISFREGKSMNFARIGQQPFGLDNYRRVLTDPAFWRSTWVSAVYVGGTVFVSFLIGLATSLLLNRDLPGTRLLRTLVLLPWAVPGVIVAIMFLWVMDGSYGVFNSILRDFGWHGGDINWFVDRRTALGTVMLPAIWKTYPLITLTLLAALQSIPKELYEAAEIDGATSVQKFFFITWPGIMGPALLVVMISALGTFRDVDIIFATTNGGPAGATQTLALYVYNEAFQYFRMGTATAVGTMMVAIAFLGTAIMAGMAGKSKF